MKIHAVRPPAIAMTAESIVPLQAVMRPSLGPEGAASIIIQFQFASSKTSLCRSRKDNMLLDREPRQRGPPRRMRSRIHDSQLFESRAAGPKLKRSVLIQLDHGQALQTFSCRYRDVYVPRLTRKGLPGTGFRMVEEVSTRIGRPEDGRVAPQIDGDRPLASHTGKPWDQGRIRICASYLGPNLHHTATEFSFLYT